MMDERQYFVDAALRYEALLEAGQPISLDAFVAREPAVRRAELRAFLEFNLTLGELDEPVELTAAEEDRFAALIARARAMRTPQSVMPPQRSLVELRKQHNLTVGRLARQMSLPVDLVARIERGKVAVATLPTSFVNKLAEVLQTTIETTQSALALPPPQVIAARLSASDGTVEAEELVVSFAQAFDESNPSAEERAVWSGDIA